MLLQHSRPTATPLPSTALGSVVWATVSATTATVTGLAPMVLSLNYGYGLGTYGDCATLLRKKK
ncbi:unnamed protein product [Ixodes pacificus]